MIKPRLRLCDTEALAHHFGVAPGTIRRWASEDHWHPYGSRRFRVWSIAQAEASWAQRHQKDHDAPEGRSCA